MRRGQWRVPFGEERRKGRCNLRTCALVLKGFIVFQQKYHTGTVNVFNALPTYYNYQYGEEWLDSLINVVYENYSYIRKKLGPYMEMTSLEGSYLLFLNLGKYAGDDTAHKCLLDKCHILANPGEEFDIQ